MSRHFLNNFEMQKHYENKPGFNSRNNLKRLKRGAYIKKY